MYANLNARMGSLVVIGFLACMISICSAYPPHYLDFWQHDPPAYSPQVDPWNSGQLSSLGSDRSSSRRIDSGSDYQNNHNHHQQHPERGHNAEEDHRHVQQQSPSYSNVGLYGIVPSRDRVGVRGADGSGPSFHGQGHNDYPNQIVNGGSNRRKSRPHVNGGGDGSAHSDIPDIVFPSDRPTNHDMIPMITDKGKGCARGTTFCEKVDGYPKDFLATILQKEARKYMDLFGEDQIESVVNVTNRIDSNDDEPLCASKEEIAYPQAAQNRDNQWLYIVNQEGYTQGVRVEICADTTGQCGSLTVPLNYETGCKQKYIYRKLLAVNGTGVVSDSFRLPSCCSCYIRNSGASSRIAGNPFISSRQSPVQDKSLRAASTGYN